MHPESDPPAGERAAEIDTRTLVSAGASLGPYRIASVLGSGGMGKVYRAVDTRLDRAVAIKFLDKDFAARFQREARAAAALNHPNICTLYDVGPDYLVIELVEGETLASQISRGPLPLSAVYRNAAQIAEALDCAHRAGIIHRDLKPGNIMFTPAGLLKVLDFGLAKFAQAGKPEDDLTGGHVVGTPAYMSPEQALGGEITAATDLFSLGIVMYEMSTGKRPFQGETSFATIDAILHQEPAPACEANPALPEGLGHIISRALAKDPKARYASAAELLAELHQVENVPDTAAPPAARKPRFSRRKALIAAGLAALTLAAVWFLIARAARSGASTAKHMLAVLPFQNLGGDSSRDYLADGLTEELITALSRLDPQRLGVIARTSSMSYKNRSIRADQIGRELGVDYIVEGTVRVDAGKVRASAQLILARDQSNLWADSYEVPSAEVMTLQRDITRRVARSLAINLLPARQSALERASTSDALAYDAYLSGRYQWNRRTEASLTAAIQNFESAIARDPGFAAAYAGLASSLDLTETYATTSHGDLASRSKTAIAKALEIDPELAEAYGTRAQSRLHYDWDHRAAENDYRRALELNPGDAAAHGWYGEFLYLEGRFEESWTQIQTAARLDPLSPSIQAYIGWWYLLTHRYQESVDQHRKLLAKWPEYGLGAFVLGLTFDQMGKPKEAMDAYQSALKSMGRVPYVFAGIAYSYAHSGNREAALRNDRCHPSGATSVIYTALGDFPKALTCIETGIANHSPLVGWLKVTPQLEPLHGNPKYQELLRRAGFE
jgi:serine/threonine-protein kinase